MTEKEVVEVTAEVIQEGGLAKPQALQIDTKAIIDGVKEIDAAITKANEAAVDCQVKPDVLKKMDSQEIKRIREGLSADIKAAEEVRRKFGKLFTEPKKAVDQAFKKAISEVQGLYDLYKAEEDSRAEAEREGRRNDLEQVFRDFVPEGIGELIGFDRVLEKQWLNKSFGPKKAENALTDKVAGILSDWESFKKIKPKLLFPDECEREFWRTLCISDATDMDERLAEEQMRIDAMNAEVAEAQAYQRQEVSQIVQEAERQVSNIPAPEFDPVQVYLFALEMTKSQRESLVGYLKSQGVHGQPLSTDFRDYREAVKAVKVGLLWLGTRR